VSQPWAPFSVDDITDGTVATVLGLMGLLLWLAAIGHLLVMITRSAALIVLAAVTPAAAAGLVSDTGRTWFWKSVRWFLAAAFTPVLMVLMLGIGVQITTGVANGLAERTQRAIGTALPGVILILIACIAPVALFKLLAFIDPNTSSGAALRTGMAEVGGVRGLLTGRDTDDTRAGGDAGFAGRSRARRHRRTPPTPGSSTPRQGCFVQSAAQPAAPQPPRWEHSTYSGPAPPQSGPTSPTRWESDT
jgi:type IV secretion system protein TrbL